MYILKQFLLFRVKIIFLLSLRLIVCSSKNSNSLWEIMLNFKISTHFLVLSDTMPFHKRQIRYLTVYKIFFSTHATIDVFKILISDLVQLWPYIIIFREYATEYISPQLWNKGHVNESFELVDEILECQVTDSDRNVFTPVKHVLLN